MQGLDAPELHLLVGGGGEAFDAQPPYLGIGFDLVDVRVCLLLQGAASRSAPTVRLVRGLTSTGLVNSATGHHLESEVYVACVAEADEDGPLKIVCHL
jgi:hypothetical protein